MASRRRCRQRPFLGYWFIPWFLVAFIFGGPSWGVPILILALVLLIVIKLTDWDERRRQRNC